MWIHLPISVYTAEAADLTSALSWPFQVLEQSVTWKEMRRRSRSWLTTCKRSNWMMRLSGQIPEPSTGNRGVAKWIGSLAASPASRGQSPALEQGPTTNAGSGPISDRFLGMFNPEGRFLKTSPDFFEADSDPSSVTLPRSGSMRSGSLYERPMFPHRTSGNASSSWQTMTSTDAGGRDYTYPSGDHSKPFLTLTGQAANWPTATTDSATDRSKRYAQGGRPLSTIATNWLTPHGLGEKRDHTGKLSGGGGGEFAYQANNWHTPDTMPDAPNKNSNTRSKPPGLGNQAQSMMWATPEARDYKGPTITPEHPEGFNKNLANDVADWPTPTTQEIAHPDAEITDTGRRKSADGKNSHSLNLEDRASTWATPQSRDGKGRTGFDNQKDLPRDAANWQTPTVQDSEKATTRLRDDHQNNLTAEAANWPTPAARDYKGDYSDEALTRKDGKSRMDALPQVTSRWLTPSANEDAAGTLAGNMQNMLSHQVQEALSGNESSKSDQTLPRLNPKFVEWMMGWPEGWICLAPTNSKSSATE